MPDDRFITELRLRLLTPGGHFDQEARSLTVDAWIALAAAAEECRRLLAERLASLGIQPDEQATWHISFETL